MKGRSVNFLRFNVVDSVTADRIYGGQLFRNISY